MRSRIASLAALLVGTAQAPAQNAAAPAAAPLEQLVPRSTVLLLSFPRPGALHAAIDQIPVFQIAREAEVQQFYQSYKQRAAQLFDSVLGMASDDYYERLEQLDRVFDRQMALALFEKPGARSEPQFVMLLDSSGPADKVHELADALGRGVGHKLFDAEPKREHVGDADITMLSGAESDLAYAVRGTTLFAAADRAALDLVLRGGGEDALAKDELFRAARAKVSTAAPLFFAYLNMHRAQELAVEDDPALARANDALGLSGVHGIAFGLGLDGAELRDRVFLAMPDGAKGMFRSLSVNAVHTENARLAPADAFSLFSIALKPIEIYRAFAELAREQGSPLHAAVGEPLDRIEQEIGLQIGKDFVELLGGELTLSVSLPSGAALFPSLVVTADLHDPAAFEKSLSELARKALAIELREMEFLGFKIHYQAAAARSSPLVFSFAVAGDTLVTSYLPLLVKGALSRMKSGDAGLFGQEEFQQALKKVGDCNGLVYLNTARLFTYLYGLLVPLAQMLVPASEMPFDPATLPTAECIAKHLKFTVSGIHGEQHGLFIDSVSEGVGPAAFAAYGTVALVATAPGLMRSAARDRLAECSWHLQSAAMNLRATENGEFQDQYPSAEEFARRRAAPDSPLNAPGIWLCPSDRRAKQDDAAYSSYEYYPATHPAAPPPSVQQREFIVLYDRAAHHFGGRNVATADGRVEWLEEAEFERRLKRQTERLAAPGSDR